MSNKNIVIYLGRAEFPDKNALAQRVVSNAKLFKNIGEYKVVLIGGNKNLKSTSSILDTKSNVSGFEYYSYPYPNTKIEWIKNLISIKLYRKVFSQYTGQIKYIVINDIGFFNAISLLLFAKLNNIVLISDTVDWFVKKEGKFPINALKNLDVFLSMYIGKPIIKNIICISDYLGNFYKDKNCNVVVIPSLTDKEDPKFQTEDYKTQKNEVAFLYAGSPGSKENMDYIFRAIHDLSNEKINVTLDVCGISKEDIIEKYPQTARKVSELENQKTVTFHGKIPHKEVLKMIQKTDFFTFAREENVVTSAGFPTKFSESLACGTPVVTTPTSDIKKYLINGMNGFLSTDCNYESYLNSMRKAATTEKDERENMHSYCRTNNPLSFESFSEELNNFLRLAD